MSSAQEEANRLEEKWVCPDCGWDTDWLPSINRHTGKSHGWVFVDGPGSEKVDYEEPEPEETEDLEDGLEEGEVEYSRLPAFDPPEDCPIDECDSGPFEAARGLGVHLSQVHGEAYYAHFRPKRPPTADPTKQNREEFLAREEIKKGFLKEVRREARKAARRVSIDEDDVAHTVAKVIENEDLGGSDELTPNEVQNIARKVFDHKIHEHRRRTLEDMGMALLEGRLTKREKEHDVEIRIDHTNVEELLNHYFEQGDHVRIIAQVYDPDERNENAHYSDSSRECALCGATPAPDGVCEDCKDGEGDG